MYIDQNHILLLYGTIIEVPYNMNHITNNNEVPYNLNLFTLFKFLQICVD